MSQPRSFNTRVRPAGGCNRITCPLAVMLAAIIFLCCLVNSAMAVGPFVEVTGAGNPLNGVDVGSDSVPVFVDIDDDGDLDVFIGAENGVIFHYENCRIELETDPLERCTTTGFEARFSTKNPLFGDFGSNSHPAFMDYDNDGDQDVFIGNSNGTILYLENLTDLGGGILFTREDDFNPFSAVMTEGGYSAPTFIDIDGDVSDTDIDQDAFFGEASVEIPWEPGTFVGHISFWEDQGGGFSEEPLLNPYLGNLGVGEPSYHLPFAQRPVPAFADTDGDGDVDVYVGAADGTIRFFRNFNTYPPWFGEGTGTTNPFYGVDVGGNSAPTFADIDNDGDLDAFIGAHDGKIRYFRNEEITAVTLTVVIDGNGLGLVYSDPVAGDFDNCRTATSPCEATYNSGTTVTLTVEPFYGPDETTLNSVFAGWTGACDNVGPCVVTPQGNTELTANIVPGIPQVDWTAATQTVSEDVTQVTISAALSLSGQPVIAADDVTVPFTVSGTAEAGGVDHNLVNGTITIPAGSVSASINFFVVDDNTPEPGDETVILTMGEVSANATRGPISVHTVIITDNDAGNINNDNSVDLADAIIALQILAGGSPAPLTGIIVGRADINQDGRIGMAEVLFVLQVTADLR